ncbi:MAG: NADH:flavin oxidoreductase [Clostridiales bacterium]|jgi:2,4-dienoyl-CoA reductase-like NADH-dependent reductase (Old Yellow Enzyme family)|nr:NADH:flavin oxidoreductase [Clostridiales bacterium]
MKTLFDTTHVENMVLKNRFIRAAIGEKTTDGHVNQYILDLYTNLAQGGVGTMITGFTLVDESEKSYPIMAFYDDSFADGHRSLTNTAHSLNANIILQLVYVGSYVMGNAAGVTVLAPSAVENLNKKTIPKEISLEEIKNIQNKFANAALRAKNAGYDGIEIHAAHGFLLSQFMTPYYNRRNDLYGGSTPNRARMALETYEAIRKAVGNDYPVWIKINVVDGIEDGVSFDDVLYLCNELSNKGIDAIEISGNWKSRENQSAYFKDEAEAIASKNKTAVILTGGNNDFKEMTEILNTTKISYFGMARALAKYPDLINKFVKENT